MSSATKANGSSPSVPAHPRQGEPAPVLDVSARKALVEQAVGKSTRQVMQMLAAVDPALAVPADKVRPLNEGRWELKAVIDEECQRGLEQLKGLLSHVDPNMTLGQLVGRLVRDGLDRYDPGRPPRRRANRTRATGADRTSAPKWDEQPAGAGASPSDTPCDPDPPSPSAGRAIPAGVRRQVWQRDQGRCRYEDPVSGRRCGSRHLLQVDHIFPYAVGGGAELQNLRLLCFAHHRHRHAVGVHAERLPRDCPPPTRRTA